MSKTETPLKYKVGDEVRIIADRAPLSSGKILRHKVNAVSNGTIRHIMSEKSLPYHVHFLHVSGKLTAWWFADKHLEDVDAVHPMPAPDYDLEDLELAQMIMDEMKDG